MVLLRFLEAMRLIQLAVLYLFSKICLPSWNIFLRALLKKIIDFSENYITFKYYSIKELSVKRVILSFLIIVGISFINILAAILSIKYGIRNKTAR